MNRKWQHGLILVGVTLVSTLVLWLAAGMPTVYQNFDGPYYVAIAKCGYDKECIGHNFSFPLPLEYYPAHFPLYPAVMRMLALTGVGYLRAMVLVAVGAAAGAALVLYRLVEKNKWGDPLWISLAWLFWWPRMWVSRSVGGAETLLMLCLLAAVYFVTEKKYLPAAVMGAAVVLAKPPGILLFAGLGLWWIAGWRKTGKPDWRAWPLLVMPVVLLGLFAWFGLSTGDFFAYFHSGDNIHLQSLPFRIFDSSQPWVGTWWLEDVLWIYLAGAVGVIGAYKKSPVLGWFGAVFLTTIFFVSHRDIARYSLPLVPVVLIGVSEIFDRKEVRWVLGLLTIPLFFYSLNFLLHNALGIGNWQPLL